MSHFADAQLQQLKAMSDLALELHHLADRLAIESRQRQELAREAARKREQRREHRRRVETVAKLMLDGADDETIAKAIDRREAHVDVFKKEALGHLRTLRRARRNQLIIDMFKAGARDCEIARAAQVSPSTVTRVLRNHRLGSLRMRAEVSAGLPGAKINQDSPVVKKTAPARTANRGRSL